MRPLLLSCAVVAALAPAPADARKKQAPPEFAAARPVPVPVPRAANGAIFQADAGFAGLHEGWRARRVGDPLTIVLVERTAATKSANSQLDSRGGFGLVPPATGPLALFAPTDATVSGNRNFRGGGTADQANSLVGEVSVTVVETYPNGTMLVQGQKRVTLNRGDEFVRIRGVVRMADVDLNNRVPSTRVADAEIAYTGKGDVARASRQGWLSRFFQVLSPF
jgi:flagellar L-ring protein FlgH